MPISGWIERKILCMHGGLSPQLKYVDQLFNLPRPVEAIPDQGLLCDVLWSDPDQGVEEWGKNTRGVSFVFGEKVLNQFAK